MSFPNIPNVTPTINLTRDDAINLLLSSIAFEELGLSHIINAEGEKIQYVLGTIPGLTGGTATIADVLAVDQSVKSVLDTTVKKELLLQAKLESVLTAPTLVPVPQDRLDRQVLRAVRSARQGGRVRQEPQVPLGLQVLQELRVQLEQLELQGLPELLA